MFGGKKAWKLLFDIVFPFFCSKYWYPDSWRSGPGEPISYACSAPVQVLQLCKKCTTSGRQRTPPTGTVF